MITSTTAPGRVSVVTDDGPQFKLTVNGVTYGGWTQLSVIRSLEQLAHSFHVGLTDRWSDNAKSVPIHAGDSAKVIYKGAQAKNTTVTTGWIDEDTLEYDATTRDLGFSGRSKTGDLIDCVAINKPGSWSKVGLLKIAKDICQPFGIKVSTTTDLGQTFAHFALTPGETCFSALERACRMRGVLMITLGSGDVSIERAGQFKLSTVLKYGVNILKCNKRVSMAERFSVYKILSQISGGGQIGDSASAKSLTRSASSSDSWVTRYRPTTISAESTETGTELQKRADWERNVRAGRAARVTYTVDGWEDGQGALWRPNTLVPVSDPEAHISGNLLIVTATHTRGEDGTHTVLELAHPSAFTIEPLPTKKVVDGNAMWKEIKAELAKHRPQAGS